jgi:hypothetical protein
MNQPEKKTETARISDIVSLIEGLYSGYKRKAHLASWFTFFGILLAGTAILVFVESGHYLSPDVKSAVLFLLFVVAGTAALLLKRKSGHTTFREFYSGLFEKTGDREIYSAFELHLNPDQQNSKFYKAAIESNLRNARPGTLKEEGRSWISQSFTHRAFLGSAALLMLGLVLFSYTSLTAADDTRRALTFWETYVQPIPWNFAVAPGDTTIEHGATLRASVQFDEGNLPGQVFFLFRTDVEEEYRARPMRPAEPGSSTYIADEIELTSDISYRVEMDQFRSDAYRVHVRLQPRFEELIATVTPPAYTGLNQSRSEYPFSGIALYPGSTLQLEGKTNKPLQQASVTINGQTTELRHQDPDGEDESNKRYAFSYSPESSDTLTFSLLDDEGLRNRNPFRTIIHLRDDQYPVVSIQEPTGTVLKTDPGNLMVYYQATDDFGLTRATLLWEHHRAFVDEPSTSTRDLERPRNGRTESFSWNLRELEMRPRDEVRFRIRVWDNDEVSGYKWGESQTVVIQVPSLADYFEDLDSRERDVQGELDNISENFRDMEREYEEFLERLRQNPEGGFEEQQIMEEISERREQIDESVRRMNEKFEEIRSEMQRNDRVSEETRRAYRELQQLMQELDDPALREAMEQLQRALENMSPQEIERALENMDFNENLYRERLERTVELFKRLKMNSDLDKFARQFEDLADRTAPLEDQNLKQLQEELETVKEDAESLGRQLQDLDSNPPRRSEEMLRQLRENAQNTLEQARDELEQLQRNVTGDSGDGGNGESDPADGDGTPSEQLQQQQEQISQQFRSQAENFRSSIQQMSGQQLQVNILALQRSLYTLLDLSNMQEHITRTASETRNRSQGFVELARIQKNVSDQFSAVSDTLFQVSSEIPGVPNQINRKKLEVERSLGRAMDEMVERSQRNSSITTRESLGGINDLTSMLASLIDQLMDQQGGGGGGGMSMQQMVEQLQQMSGDQLQLNQQLQDLINDIQGERLTREESDRLDQLARQQNEIRRQLQELQRRGALDPGDRSLSDIQRMIEEMEESINEMRGGVTDPIMVQRQQNILSRMLETEESLQQRGESEEREGTAVTGFDRTLPPEMTLEELQQEIRSRMQDPNFTRFSEQYQRIIERYFEQLRRFEDRPVQIDE